jgi:hypothetical protein
MKYFQSGIRWIFFDLFWTGQKCTDICIGHTLIGQRISFVLNLEVIRIGVMDRRPTISIPASIDFLGGLQAIRRAAVKRCPGQPIIVMAAGAATTVGGSIWSANRAA